MAAPRRATKAAEDAALAERIKAVQDPARGRNRAYGAPGVTAELHQYFPKGTDLSRWTAEDLAAIAHTLNTRPRKGLVHGLVTRLVTRPGLNGELGMRRQLFAAVPRQRAQEVLG